MEAFTALLALVWGTHRSPVASPCKGWKCVCNFFCDALSTLQFLFNYMYKSDCSSSFVDIHDDAVLKHLRISDSLYGEPIGHRWFPLARAVYAYVSLLFAWISCQRNVRDVWNFRCHDSHVTSLNVALNPIWLAYDLCSYNINYVRLYINTYVAWLLLTSLMLAFIDSSDDNYLCDM